MHCYLQQLAPGTRFRVVGMPELVGTLLRTSECSSTVKVEGGVRDVEYVGPDGETKRLRASRASTTTWAPATLVEPITTNPIEEQTTMSTKAPKKPAAKNAKSSKASQAAATAKKAKPAGEEKPKKLSAIDAAAQVLAASKEPMTTKEMIDTMAVKGLWSSPGGKTPHATLYSAILREIGTKGKEARFTKVERGKFKANA